MTDSRLACTLPSAEVPQRAAQLHGLSERLISSTRERTRAAFRFPASAEADVRAFVRDESACCSFFHFAVTVDRESVHLQVDAPPHAAPMIDALVAGLDPDVAGREKERGLRDLSGRSL